MKHSEIPFCNKEKNEFLVRILSQDWVQVPCVTNSSQNDWGGVWLDPLLSHCPGARGLSTVAVCPPLPVELSGRGKEGMNGGDRTHSLGSRNMPYYTLNIWSMSKDLLQYLYSRLILSLISLMWCVCNLWYYDWKQGFSVEKIMKNKLVTEKLINLLKIAF